MKRILFLVLLTSQAHAEKYDMFYQSASGSKLDSVQAITSSLKGETVYKCQTVESKVSKNGTSIGVTNTKKPKVEKGE